MQGSRPFMDYNDAFYPPDAVMSTFIGNHDLPRSIHYAEQTLPAWLGSNARRRPDDQRRGQRLDGRAGAGDRSEHVRATRRTRSRVLLTNKGAPLIYYGDEIGLPGAGDPDNRRMMQWTGYSARRSRRSTLASRRSTPSARRTPPCAGARGPHSQVDQDLWVYQLTTLPGDPTPTRFTSPSTAATRT